MRNVTILEAIIPLRVSTCFPRLCDLKGAIVGDAQARTLTGVLRIVSGVHDHFMDFQPKMLQKFWVYSPVIHAHRQWALAEANQDTWS
jgi:hypothetical protein